MSGIRDRILIVGAVASTLASLAAEEMERRTVFVRTPEIRDFGTPLEPRQRRTRDWEQRERPKRRPRNRGGRGR